jgi:hypothetical protein
MGDNARHARDWHNTEIGVGYQAKGVIRQPTVASFSTTSQPMKVIDMSRNYVVSAQITQFENQGSSTSLDKNGKDVKKSKNKKRKTSKAIKKEGKHASSIGRFNPLLQAFVNSLE